MPFSVRNSTAPRPGRIRDFHHGLLGHGLGLEHEQQRRDRDRYVRVVQENISPHYRWTWNPEPFYGADISPYNYQSVMHYDFFSSKRNRRRGHPALETIPPHMPVGQLAHRSPGGRTTSITPGDADTVARMVGLTPESWTVSTNPLGLAVVVDGEEVTTPAVLDWSPGSEHTLSVPSPQERPGSRYRFGRWSDAGGGGTRTITATFDTTLYEANFVAAHRISTRVRPEGAGTVTISPGSSDGYYPLRSEITISAEPAAGSGFRFVRWETSADYVWAFATHGASANPARTFAMPGLSYTAVFTQEPILRVESNADPTAVEINGNYYYTPVALEAGSLPAPVTVAQVEDFWEHDKGYRDRFSSWSDGGDASHAVSVSRTEDTILKLMLTTERRLETDAWHDWHGNAILVAPPSDDGFYAEGTEVRLTASARPPAKFIGWNGDVAGRDPAVLVTMDVGKLAEAVFALDATELQPGVPVDVSLHWNASDRNIGGKRYYVQMPPEANELEVQFSTRTVTPGAEAGLFLDSQDIWPNWVVHASAHRILRGGVVTIRVGRPATRWPAAYFVLVRAGESDSGGPHRLEGTLVATVTANRAPQALGTLEDRTLSLGGEALFVAVATAFMDPDGDALTYQVSSSAPAVATVAVSGSTVTVTPVAAGMATVTVAATDTSGSNATQQFAVTVVDPRTFTDDPIIPGTTPIRAIHFRELRERIAGLRARVGLPAVGWTDPTLVVGVTPVKGAHLTELRLALDAVYEAVGRPGPVYADAVVAAEVNPIRAAHIMELRDAVLVLESGARNAP